MRDGLSEVRRLALTVIDVGANAGDFSLDVAQRSGARVIAIEPVPELVRGIRRRSALERLTNVEVLELAIAGSRGRAQFNVAQHADWGVSSLLDFRPELKSDEYWKDRTDLYFDTAIEVEVQPLSFIVESLSIEEVDFIKIDAQGKDLEVLASFGAFIHRVKAGMLEVSCSLETRLYEGELVTLVDVLVYLRSEGFLVYAIKPNDPACNEVNVYFHRGDVDWRLVEEALYLRGVPLYDGKWFWHVPSPTMVPPQSVLTELQKTQFHQIRTQLHTVETDLHRTLTQQAALQEELRARDEQLYNSTTEISGLRARNDALAASVKLSEERSDRVNIELAAHRAREIKLAIEIDALRDFSFRITRQIDRRREQTKADILDN